MYNGHLQFYVKESLASILLITRILSSVVRNCNSMPSKQLTEHYPLDGGFIIEAPHRAEAGPQCLNQPLQTIVGS
ncbi:MAG: hypothetical protein PVJ86_10335 [Phycisphaerales bacterium]|jgi:hypothetical protein